MKNINDYFKSLKFVDYLEEARKNPELNPKFTTYEYLKKYKDDPEIFIKFHNQEYLGVRPLVDYDTPLGIYGYNLKTIWDHYKLDNFKNFINVPFGTSRYCYIFKWSGFKKFKKISDYTETDLTYDIEKLYKLIDGCKHRSYFKDLIDCYELMKQIENYGVNNLKLKNIISKAFKSFNTNHTYSIQKIDCFIYFNNEEINKYLENELILSELIFKYNNFIDSLYTFKFSLNVFSTKQKPFKYFYNLCRWLSNGGISPTLGYNKIYYNSFVFRRKHDISTLDRKTNGIILKFPMEFESNDLNKKLNIIISYLDYAGFEDDVGEMIHTNEKYQAFFVSKNCIKILDMIHNTDYGKN